MFITLLLLIIFLIYHFRYLSRSSYLLFFFDFITFTIITYLFYDVESERERDFILEREREGAIEFVLDIKVREFFALQLPDTEKKIGGVSIEA